MKKELKNVQLYLVSFVFVYVIPFIKKMDKLLCISECVLEWDIICLHCQYDRECEDQCEENLSMMSQLIISISRFCCFFCISFLIIQII